ncbi:MAG: alanine--tRNA ligase [Patescibacteria group bacterium]
MTSREIRKKFLEFFKEKGHTIIPSASLIPNETDPTVLFTTAGMHPLVPYLLGADHPGGKRVANIQKCIRTVDIDKVGDNSHLTFFEMLGNWSFGDYFKREAIEWSLEFLTDKKWLGINKNRISVTVFAGDKDAPRDEESAKIWQSLGIPQKRIFYKGKEDNWWEPAGATGPCGPDTEMFINLPDGKAGGTEIWNDVFMEYNKRADGKYEILKQKNVDTGMGLERIAMIMQGKDNVYETDLFAPVIEKIKAISLTSYKLQVTSYRIIADHIKAATFIIADGVEPSNLGRGYVLRRLIRRAIRHGRLLGIEKNFTKEIAEVVMDIYKEQYPELLNNKLKIMNELKNEEQRFKKTLEKGLKEFEKGTEPFILFTTYGFPIELTQELAKEKGIEIDIKKFNEQLKAHQELSRTASAGMFKGGLADDSEQTTKYHTATHLLLAALRKILGEHVIQKGSNITEKRLRFDFNHPQKLTHEQIQTIEDLVNKKIEEKIPVQMTEMHKDEALKTTKISFDPSKYGEIVKVYQIGDFSIELCGGPHVKSTSELGHFKIIKEDASSAGVRRIRAVLE